MKTPPRLADRLLQFFCAPHLLEEVQGDLHERYVRDVEWLGISKANRNYTLNVLGFLRPFALKRQPDTYSSPSLLYPDMLRNYLKTSLRNLTKHKVSTFINLLGLTLGVTACLIIYLITNYELSYDTFHPDSQRIYRLVGESQFGKGSERNRVGFIPNAVPGAIRKEIVGFETVAAFHNIESEVLIPNGKEKPKRFESRRRTGGNADIVAVEPLYFNMFRYQWLAGSPNVSLNEPFKLVLSEQKARKYFGNLPPDKMLGKEVIYQDSIRVRVAGIVRDWTQPTDFTFTDFISFATIRASQLKRSINLDEWDDIWSASQAFVKLPVGATPAQFARQFDQFGKAHFQKDFKFTPALQPLSDLHFNADYQDNYSRKAHLPTLYGLMAVAGFILLIAAINFINLSTAQSVQRAREIGMRKVLGSSRMNLIIQFLNETALLTAVAVLVAVALVNPILSAFQSLTPKGLTFDLFSVQTGLYLLSVLMITTLLSGFYPSLVLSSYLPALTLKGQTALKGGQKGRLRKGLIVFQFTISLTFIIGTLMIGRQLNFMRNKDLGFQSDAVLILSPPKGSGTNLTVLYDKVKQLAGVQKATLQVFEPMGMSYGIDRVIYKSRTAEQTFDAAYKMGDETYISFYEMKLLAGRTLMKSDTAKELVINESFVKALGFKQPAEAINKQLQWRNKYYPIVGVVADFHQQSMHEKIAPTFITTAPHARSIAIKLRNREIQKVHTTLADIEQLWKTVYPDLKFEYSFLDDTIAQFYEKEQKTALLVNTATAIAILISCMGLFGLAIFTAQQRTKEIGVRKVLGASVSSIVALLSTDFLRLVIIALVIATPIAWWATNQWLQDFAYKVDMAWWVFALAGLLAVGITFLTVGFQSVKAALVNPVESLRNE